jgi:hypothetical protein
MSDLHRPKAGRACLVARAALALLVCTAVGTAKSAQAQGGELMPVESEFPLYNAVLGPMDRQITTDSPSAQAYFKQGLQMKYAFTLPASVASFEEAQRLKCIGCSQMI